MYYIMFSIQQIDVNVQTLPKCCLVLSVIMFNLFNLYCAPCFPCFVCRAKLTSYIVFKTV